MAARPSTINSGPGSGGKAFFALSNVDSRRLVHEVPVRLHLPTQTSTGRTVINGREPADEDVGDLVPVEYLKHAGQVEFHVSLDASVYVAPIGTSV